MKKLDKLILQSFIGPFILTFLVAVFILLIQYMLKYFDDFIGKDLGIGVFGELMMYFSVNMVPMALPLAILISSLMTYGQLGEHFELTAIKSAGISLPRVLLPTFILVFFLSIGAFFLNNYLVPYANLRAYSLLYDIKHQKPALDLKEGQFYGGLTGFSIKVKEKHTDGIAMSDVVIYDHSDKSSGNKKVILADSCRMYTFINDRYLMMELYDGNHYVEDDSKNKSNKSKTDISQFIRTNFKRMDIVFSLSSFDLDRTSMDLFAGNRYMKSVKELTASIDSMRFERSNVIFKLYRTMGSNYRLNFGGYIEPTSELIRVEMEKDSITEFKRKRDSVATQMKVALEMESINLNKDSLGINKDEKEIYLAKNKKKRNRNEEDGVNRSKKTVDQRLEIFRVKKARYDSGFVRGSMSIDTFKMKIDKHFTISKHSKVTEKALNLARSGKSTLKSSLSRNDYFEKSINSHVVEKYKKYAQALSCIIMFLIGAPLGAIIKRGGLGLPIIFGVIFFIIFYVFTSASDKWAKAVLIDGAIAAWVADLVLLPFGIFFLIQARRDARLFDTDLYLIWMDKLVVFWKNRKQYSLKILFKK